MGKAHIENYDTIFKSIKYIQMKGVIPAPKDPQNKGGIAE